MIPYEFHSEAEREFIESSVFYESWMIGLGESFTIEVERSITILRDYPDSGSPVGAKLRRALVRRFPYNIIYRRENDRIFIVAVAHQRRRPGYWRNRT